MSNLPPANLFGATGGDQLMMREILELLATDSPTNNQANTIESTTASSRSNKDSSSSDSDSNQLMNFGPADDTDMQNIEHVESTDLSNVASLEPAAAGQAPLAPMNLGQPSTPQSAAPMVATMASQDAESKPAAVPTPPLPLHPTTSNPAASGSSRILPTGERIHVMNEAEFDELRRKLRTQTASRRYRKRKKEETREKKKKIQELKAELARLHDIERQSKQYEERSLEDLEAELASHKQEVAGLSVKIGEAAQEELDWIKTMSSHHRK